MPLVWEDNPLPNCLPRTKEEEVGVKCSPSVWMVQTWVMPLQPGPSVVTLNDVSATPNVVIFKMSQGSLYSLYAQIIREAFGKEGNSELCTYCIPLRSWTSPLPCLPKVNKVLKGALPPSLITPGIPNTLWFQFKARSLQVHCKEPTLHLLHCSPPDRRLTRFLSKTKVGVPRDAVTPACFPGKGSGPVALMGWPGGLLGAAPPASRQLLCAEAYLEVLALGAAMSQHYTTFWWLYIPPQEKESTVFIDRFFK